MEGCYLRHEVVPFEEALDVEFKGHRDFSLHNLTMWGKYLGTRQFISKYACGMLNSGQGGTIYMGVLDSGVVGGLMLTTYQKDHIILNISETFKKFEPQVPSHLYSVVFVPVKDNSSDIFPPSNLLQNRNQNENLEHIILNNKYCWCDYDCLASYNRGILPPFYVIELRIKRWNGYDPKNKSFGSKNKQGFPMFICEDNIVYIRRNATNERMTADEIARRTAHL